MFDVAWQRNRGDEGMRYPYATGLPICSSLSGSEDLYLLDESVEQSVFCEIPRWGFQSRTVQCAREEGRGVLLVQGADLGLSRQQLDVSRFLSPVLIR